MNNDVNIPTKLVNHFQEAKSILVLTGAGISSESGIPTFRGNAGYWVVDSQNYFPEDMATHKFFKDMPEELWKWYQHRQNTYLDASPNSGHYAITELEKWASENNKKFLLITQNVDNLHPRAGIENVIEIHGNIFKYRCSDDFTDDGHQYDLLKFDKFTNDDFPPHCKKCNKIFRPHVLWFDEFYNEKLFQAQTSIDFALKTDVLIVVGTTLTTTIPNRIVGVVYRNKKTILEVNPEPMLNAYTEFIFENSSSIVLPILLKNL